MLMAPVFSSPLVSQSSQSACPLPLPPDTAALPGVPPTHTPPATRSLHSLPQGFLTVLFVCACLPQALSSAHRSP